MSEWTDDDGDYAGVGSVPEGVQFVAYIINPETGEVELVPITDLLEDA